MTKTRKIFLLLTMVALLIGSASYAAMNWYALETCDNSLTVVSVGALKTKLGCYGGTAVYDGYSAGVIVYLERLDEDNDWVTVTAWNDYDVDYAFVDVDYKVPAGTYRLSCTHRSYPLNNYSVPLETHYTTSVQVTTH